MTEQPVRPDRPGTYSIIGIGSGLGVAMMTRDVHGLVTVVPTEGGHLGFMDGLPRAAEIIQRVRIGNAPVTAENILSGPGLLNLYQCICALRGQRPVAASLAQLLGPSACRNDPAAAEALEFFGEALWHFAGNMTLAYGAWDGLILTGSITAALKPVLRRPALAEHFLIKGVWSRILGSVPRATISFRYAELEGAAVALLMQDRLRHAAQYPGLAEVA